MLKLSQVPVLLATAALALTGHSRLVADAHPNLQRGFAAESFATGDIDSVNLLNGNLVAHIPLGPVYPVSPALSYAFRLVYNSHAWEHVQVGCGAPLYGHTIQNPNANAGLGWTLTLGHLWRPTDRWLGGSGVFNVGRFLYVSADGAQHRFYPTLKDGDPDEFGDGSLTDLASQRVLYSRDGSYLRLRVEEVVDGSQTFRIDFPDGQVHTFVGLATSNYAQKTLGARLTRMEDRFGNWVSVDPTVSGWRVRDSTLREHQILSDPPQGEFPERITELRLAAFGGTSARYRLLHAVQQVQREGPHTPNLCGTPPNSQDPPFPNLSEESAFSQLTRVSMADDTTYEMAYGGGSLRPNGRLATLQLPLGGQIAWEYGVYKLPAEGCLGVNGCAQPLQQARTSSMGVVRRTTSLAPQGPVLGEWLYEPSYRLEPHPQAPPDSPPTRIVEVKRSALQVQTGVRIDNYFSAYADYGNGTPTFGVYLAKEYGLPYTRAVALQDADAGSLFLSTETYQCPQGEQNPAASSCTLRRSTWLRYDQDDVTSDTSEEAAEANRRVVAERTRFDDDGGRSTTVYKPVGSYEGLGHFSRSVSRDGVSSPSNDLVDETVWTWENGTKPDAASPWLLELPKSRRRCQGTCSGDNAIWEEQELAFDQATGFLLCERRLLNQARRGETDLLVTYEPNGQGQVARERWFGGDDAAFRAPAGGSDACGQSTPAHVPRYSFSHLYERGVRRQTTVDGGTGPSLAGLKLLDLTIDPNTAMASAATDAAGLRTDFAYDLAGRLTGVRPPGAASAETIHSFCLVPTSDPTSRCFGQPIPSMKSEVVSGASALEHEQWFFDGLGRTRRHESRRPGTGSPDQVTTEYDAVGRRTSVSQRGFASKRTLFQNFDTFGRVGTVTGPDGSLTTLAYKGVREVKRTPKVWNGTKDVVAPTTETYDGFGRLVSVVEPNGTLTKYTYDMSGRLLGVNHNVGKPGGKPSRRFTYDGRGLLTSEYHPENGWTSYTYDAKGQVLRSIDSAGSNLIHTYDAAGRLTEVASPNAVLKEYRYGSGLDMGRLAETEASNWRVDAATCKNFTVKEVFGYDDSRGLLDRRATSLVEKATAAVPRESWVQSYEFDAAGRISKLHYPNCTANCTSTALAITTDYSYGRPTKVYDEAPNPDAVFASSITYHPNGLLSTIGHGNGLTLTQVADSSGIPRPLRIQVGSSWTEGDYAYDSSGNIRSIGNRTFVYDTLSRLVEAKRPGAKRLWTYDRLGNLTHMGSVPLNAAGGEIGAIQYVLRSVEPATNRLSDAADYYVNGNVASGADGSVFTWDRFNSLKTSKFGNELWTHTYDVSGERVWSWRTPATSPTPRLHTYALRSPDGKVLRDFTRDGTNAVTWKNYIYREGQLLASQEGSETRYLALDHLGSVRLITGASGQTLSSQEYWPYGDDVVPSASTEQMKFTGHERDLGDPLASGDDLDYMHARYYKPIWGRFLSVDPARRSARLSNPQSWNRYAYAGGNPLNVVDLNGKWPTHVRHVHQGSIDRALPNVPASDRAILKQQQVVMDFDQSTRGSFKHGMRAAGGQSVEEARQQANDFVRKNLLDARKYEAEGKHDLAVSLVGRAMHTVQDSTSPQHSGFQPWDESWGKTNSNTVSHVVGEFYDPGAGSALDAATVMIWNLFQSDEELPADFFNGSEAPAATASCDSSRSSCPK